MPQAAPPSVPVSGATSLQALAQSVLSGTPAAVPVDTGTQLAALLHALAPQPVLSGTEFGAQLAVLLDCAPPGPAPQAVPVAQPHAEFGRQLESLMRSIHAPPPPDSALPAAPAAACASDDPPGDVRGSVAPGGGGERCGDARVSARLAALLAPLEHLGASLAPGRRQSHASTRQPLAAPPLSAAASRGEPPFAQPVRVEPRKRSSGGAQVHSPSVRTAAKLGRQASGGVSAGAQPGSLALNPLLLNPFACPQPPAGTRGDGQPRRSSRGRAATSDASATAAAVESSSGRPAAAAARPTPSAHAAAKHHAHGTASAPSARLPQQPAPALPLKRPRGGGGLPAAVDRPLSSSAWPLRAAREQGGAAAVTAALRLSSAVATARGDALPTAEGPGGRSLAAGSSDRANAQKHAALVGDASSSSSLFLPRRRLPTNSSPGPAVAVPRRPLLPARPGGTREAQPSALLRLPDSRRRLAVGKKPHVAV